MPVKKSLNKKDSDKVNESLSEETSRFRKIMRDFWNDFLKGFPDMESKVKYPEDPEEFYLIQHLSFVKNEDILKIPVDKKARLLWPGLTIVELMEHKNFEENRYHIENYLRTLFLLGRDELRQKASDDIQDDLESSEIYQQVLHHALTSRQNHNHSQETGPAEGPAEGPAAESRGVGEIPKEFEAFKGLPDMLENSVFGSLAKDIAGELTEDLDPEVANDPSKLLGGGNFMGIFGKVMTKLQDKMQSGEFDVQQMAQEGQKLMGQLNQNGGLQNLMNNPMISQMMGQMMGQMGQNQQPGQPRQPLGQLPRQFQGQLPNQLPVPPKQTKRVRTGKKQKKVLKKKAKLDKKKSESKDV